jgi:hypothetical protein
VEWVRFIEKRRILPAGCTHVFFDYSFDAEAKKFYDLPIKPIVAHAEYYIYIIDSLLLHVLLLTHLGALPIFKT